jgi:hypothetical protein
MVGAGSDFCSFSHILSGACSKPAWCSGLRSLV